jgi:hypothetical protein
MQHIDRFVHVSCMHAPMHIMETVGRGISARRFRWFNEISPRYTPGYRIMERNSLEK